MYHPHILKTCLCEEHASRQGSSSRGRRKRHCHRHYCPFAHGTKELRASPLLPEQRKQCLLDALNSFPSNRCCKVCEPQEVNLLDAGDQRSSREMSFVVPGDPPQAAPFPAGGAYPPPTTAGIDQAWLVGVAPGMPPQARGPPLPHLAAAAAIAARMSQVTLLARMGHQQAWTPDALTAANLCAMKGVAPGAPPGLDDEDDDDTDDTPLPPFGGEFSDHVEGEYGDYSDYKDQLDQLPFKKKPQATYAPKTGADDIGAMQQVPLGGRPPFFNANGFRMGAPQRQDWNEEEERLASFLGL